MDKSQNGQECSFHYSDVENEEVEVCIKLKNYRINEFLCQCFYYLFRINLFQKFFYPIQESNENGTTDNNSYPIELQVTNLDQNIDPKEMKHILSSFFTEYVTVSV